MAVLRNYMYCHLLNLSLLLSGQDQEDNRRLCFTQQTEFICTEWNPDRSPSWQCDIYCRRSHNNLLLPQLWLASPAFPSVTTNQRERWAGGVRLQSPDCRWMKSWCFNTNLIKEIIGRNENTYSDYMQHKRSDEWLCVWAPLQPR